MEKIPSIEQKEQPEESELLRIARTLEESEDAEEVRRIIPELLSHLEIGLQSSITDDVDVLYREMEQMSHMLLRVERISRVVESIERQIPLHIGTGGEDKYANAVTANNDGVRIAFAEGEAPGPVKLLMGFDIRSVIGFDSLDLKVSDIDIDKVDLRNQWARAALCRHVEGDLTPEKIKYFILRLPRTIVSDDILSSAEKKNNFPYIFRGIKLYHERKQEQQEAA